MVFIGLQIRCSFDNYSMNTKTGHTAIDTSETIDNTDSPDATLVTLSRYCVLHFVSVFQVDSDLYEKASLMGVLGAASNTLKLSVLKLLIKSCKLKHNYQ